MRKSKWIVICGAMWSLATATMSRADAPLVDYKLSPGDKVSVGVYDDPKLVPQEITITPDGKFAFPMVGEVVAGGRTAQQIRNELETKLKKFIAEPVVIFAVTEVKGSVAYVIGQVNKPGPIVMNPRINVLQALSIAGGGNPYAKLDDVVIIRTTAAGQRLVGFNYGRVSSGKSLEQNVTLESGDVVVVP